MLTLSLNNTVIPVPADFSMRLTFKSPTCDFGKIPGSYGLGISLPINEYTRSILGNPERFSKYRSGNDQKFPGFEVRFSGVLLMAGTLQINSSGKGNYDATLTDQLGVMSDKEQERDILDIDIFAEDIQWNNRADYTPDNSPYCCFPIQNSDFFKDKGVVVTREATIPDPDRPGKTKKISYDIEVMQYCYIKSVKGQVNSQEPIGIVKLLPSSINLHRLPFVGNTYETGEVSVVTPFFYLGYVVKNILKDSDFHIVNNFLDTDTNIRKICIYNNFDITRLSYQYGEQSIQTSSYFDFTIDGFVRVDDGPPISVGYIISNYTRAYDGITITPKNHLPKMTAGDFLLSVQNLLNVVFFFKPNGTVDILSRETILTATEVLDLNDYFLGTWEIGEKKNVALKYMRKHDDNDLVFSEGYTDLADRRADIRETVSNYTQLLLLANPKEGDIRFVTDSRSFYEYKWITSSKVDETTYDTSFTDVFGWERVSVGLQDGWFEYGREEVDEIKTNWSACMGINNSLGFPNTAIVQQPGNMSAWKSKQQPFSPRFLIQLVETYGGNETPTFSFEYEKENSGLFANRWKYWNPFWANRLPVAGSFDFPVNMLRHLIYNICEKYRTRQGEFIIEELSCEIYVDRIGQTEIKGYKVE